MTASTAVSAVRRATPADPTDTDALVRDCLPLVKHHVRSIASRIPSHVDHDDLMSAGMFALATCARRYDPTVGTSFAQFASARIRGALVDELRAIDWASRSVRKRARDVTTTADELGQSLGRTASGSEIADAMGISVQTLSGIRADAQRGQVVSLQAVLDDDADMLPVDDAGLDAGLLRREQFASLEHALAGLPDRLRTVIEQYFFGQRKMSDIAAELGVTESRVSQLRSQALLRLRDLMHDGADPAAAEEQAEPVRPVRRTTRPVTRRAPTRTLAAVG